MVCNSNNVGYRWVCTTCQNRNKTKVYEGESSRSARLRGIEHLKQYVGKKEDSVLYKHKILEHNNEDVEFKMEITGVFKDALSRQAEESVRIHIISIRYISNQRLSSMKVQYRLHYGMIN